MNYLRREQGKKRVKRLLSIYRARAWDRTTNKDFYADDGEFANRLLKTRVPCSGPCCGNPRRHFGTVTRQERLADSHTQATG